jgi:integrase
MLLLRYGNIKNGYIEFERAKTKRTRRVSKKIKIIITNEILEIISRWGNENQGVSTYLFPIINGKMSIERQRAVIQQTTRLVNKHMKKLGQDLGIELHISTQSARHSYATTMMRNDMSIQFISDSLGHSSSKTTQNYLAGFEDETYAKAANILSELTSHNEK